MGVVLFILTFFFVHPHIDDSPEATMTALWEALSHGPGKGADAERLRAIFHPEARVSGIRMADRRSTLTVRSAAQFIERVATPDRDAFYEREVHREIRRYGDFAQVWCTVESRTDPTQKTPNFTGVNSLNLYWDGTRWLILDLFYHVEDPARPIPTRLRRKHKTDAGFSGLKRR